jgi:hypothetical protein
MGDGLAHLKGPIWLQRFGTPLHKSRSNNDSISGWLATADHIDSRTGKQRVWRVRTRRTHGAKKANVDELPERADFLTIVPPSVVHVLSDELEWGLRPVLLLHRHVEIVNEHDGLLAYTWSVHSLATLVKLRIDHVLRLIRARLGRKRHQVRNVPDVNSDSGENRTQRVFL